MRKPLIPLDDELRQAIRTSTIVTANARQASELRYSWAYECVLDGRHAWHTPNIKHFDAWVLELYEELMRMGHSTATFGLLHRSALNLAFRLCAPDDEYFKHTRAVVDAWSIYCGWNLQRVRPDLDQTENGRLFHNWITEFEKLRKEQEVITVPQLPRLIAVAIGDETFHPSPVSLFACDELNPSQRDLIQQFERTGRLGKSLRPLLQNSHDPKVHVFNSIARERSGLVQWARERLSVFGISGRIGVVVPQTSMEYLTIRRHWEAAFFDGEGIDQLVNVGAGVPLIETRLCQDIVKLLTWTISDLNFSEVLQLGRSPYLTELEIPSQFPTEFPDHVRFAGYASRSGALAPKQITRLTTRRASLLSDWAAVALQVFRLAGWMTDEHSDEDRRVHASIVEALNNVAHLSAFVGRVPWRQAVELIRDGLRASQLAYDTRYAPIQVVDRMESIGLQFDALWVCNVAEDNWPSDPNPNPMIPISVQRRAVIPRVTHQQMLDWSQRLSNMWLLSAPEVVLSAAPNEEQTEARPSRLFSGRGNAELSEILTRPEIAEFDHPWGIEKQHDMIREYIADKGTPLPLGEIGKQHTSIIRDQSNCPFRAWAIHRTKLPEGKLPHRFPDPLDRGTMVHRVLQVLVERARDQSTIADIKETDIELAIDDSLRPLKKRLLPDRFIEHEKARIREIVASWQQMEESREAFQVVEVEKEYALELEGFTFKLRVDRVDRTEFLSALVIDYKTGTVALSNWSEPRPRDPQMPLYSMAVPDCDGLAYEQIDGLSIKMKGIASRATREKGIALPDKQFKAGFKQMKNEWRDAVSAIAREFKEGVATVNPTFPNYICRSCHLDSFCRTFSETEMPPLPEAEVE
ncbi:MAG: PD-(D/E)XK nuclease family protein [Gammaproteobacteria bacterium]|nr:PD-(D/E)XK nuclease family protein [Gammaproteobacteria bacterium]